MLIDLKFIIKKYNLNIKGILHIGAHECEELNSYINNNIPIHKQLWIEAIPEKVIISKKKYPGLNILNHIISDVDNKIVSFKVTNNYESSSILDLKTHLIEHPHIHVINKFEAKTKTIKTIYDENNINYNLYNFINLDIQGAELLALKGMGDILNNFDYIYIEINEKELYKDCALLPELNLFLQQKSFIRVETEMTPHGWGDALYIKKIFSDKDIFNNCNSNTNGELLFYENIKKYINIIFDIGCRDDSLFLNFKGIVHYFDPEKNHINSIINKKNYNNKNFFNYFGLGKENDTIFYYPKFQSFYDRVNSCKYSDDHNKKLLTIKKAKDYIITNGIDLIDFVKIDTEGYELNVILGFEDYIKNIKIIQFEYGGTFLDNNVKLFDIISYLSKNNFSNFYYLSSKGLCLITNFEDHYQYCNIICFNNKYYSEVRNFYNF